MICILGAVKQELSGIKRRMRVEEHIKLGRADAWKGTWQGQQVVLVRTGIGKAPAVEALRRAVETFHPSLIISTGYAGAADPDLKIGDLVVADRVLDIQSGSGTDFSSRQPVNEIPTDPGWAEKAVNLPGPDGATVLRGGLLTVDAPVCDPQKKRAAGDLYSVLAVEMESAAMIVVAGEKKVPFLSVRSISDTVEEELIDVTPFIGADGEVSNLKAGWHVFTHPGKIGNVLNMRDHARRATETLTDFLESLLSGKIL